MQSVTNLSSCTYHATGVMANSTDTSVHPPPQAGKGPRAPAAAPQQARQAATMALMAQLRPLLRKYQAHPAVAAPLASLPQHLHLELFALKQEEAELEQVRGGCVLWCTAVLQCTVPHVHCTACIRAGGGGAGSGWLGLA